VADNGRTALEILKRAPYSLIFMDVQMPEMNGFDTTRAVRAAEAKTGKHIPIVAMTAHAMEGRRMDCIGAGMDDYLSKPINPAQLEAIVDKWLPSGTQPVATAPGTTRSGLPGQETTPGEGPSPEAPVDLDTLTLTMGTAGAHRLFRAVLAQAPVDLANVKSAQEELNASKLSHFAHGLKGVYASLRAEKLRQLAADLESAGRAQNWELAARLIEDHERSMAELLQFIHNLLGATGENES
jgi:two-component system, sensor histidine kinase and response regulator